MLTIAKPELSMAKKDLKPDSLYFGFASRLRLLVGSERGSISRFAEKCVAESGGTFKAWHSTLSQYLSGTVEPGTDKVATITRIAGTSSDWLLKGQGTTSSSFTSESLSKSVQGPSLAQTYFDRGELYFSLGQNKEAIAQFAASVKHAGPHQTPLKIRALLRAARAQVRLENFVLAVDFLQQARLLIDQTCPEDLLPETLLGMANVEFRRGDFSQAQNHLLEAQATLKNPVLLGSSLHRRYWELIGALHQAYERWPEAMAAYEQIEPLSSPFEDLSNLNNQINQGIVLARLGRTDEAAALAQSVIELVDVGSNSHQSFRALAYAVAGLAYELSGDLHSALKAYLESDKIIESSEAVIGAARCMQALSLPLFEFTLKRGITLLSQERAVPYSDCTPEFLFVLEVSPESTSIASGWVANMSKLVPMNYWATPARTKLLEMLD